MAVSTLTAIGAVLVKALPGIMMMATRAIMNSTFGAKNAHNARIHQERLAKEQRDFTMSLEENRQNFQLETLARNTALQESLLQKNHALRLEEVKLNFESFCKQAEFKLLLDNWPLITPPQVIRASQILPDNTVAMRVFFSHSSDQLFNALVYPFVEQGIRDFIDIYHNFCDTQNILFYHEAYKSNHHGGAVEENIKYMLDEVPVLIVDANVLPDEVRIAFRIWGFGGSSQHGKHQSVFSIPYERKIGSGIPDADYYKSIAITMLAYIKFIIGYSFDAYNLIQYDKAPLLLKVAPYDVSNGKESALLHVPELVEAFGATYSGMANAAWQSKELTAARRCSLHKTQLMFAASVASSMSPAETLELLNESLASWVSLRSEQTVDAFLQEIIADTDLIPKFFSTDDQAYWGELSNAYAATGKNPHPHKALVRAIQKILDCFTGALAQPIVPSAEKPARVYPSLGLTETNPPLLEL